jgi:hypothetical protein
MIRRLLSPSLLALSIAGAILAACEGCPRPTGVPAVDARAELPSLRIYFVSNLAGALEPCGCVKSQLGGLDHAAALIDSEREQAPNAIALAAGPTYFLDVATKPDRVAQEKQKALALAEGLEKMGLVAVSEGENDVALGESVTTAIRERGKVAMLGRSRGGVQTQVYRKGDVTLAVLGVSAKRGENVDHAAITTAFNAAKANGANMVVALASVGRGEAKRIADSVPGLTAVIVGEPDMGGEANTPTPAGERIDKVIVAETSNHLQTVGILDFYVRDKSYEFADASGLDQGRAKSALYEKIQKLRGEKANLEQAKKSTAAMDMQREIDDAKRELSKLESAPAPQKGSYFRYRVRPIESDLGESKNVSELLRAFYKDINESNRKAFANRTPTPVGKDEPSYTGVESCVGCHADAKKVWDGTAHAHAYKTLSDQFKEFNLDCVGCHVTGYERPGGSTVTAVEKLKDVQCEVCHGPGSRHAANPKVAIPVKQPTAQSCEACHHPPHVHSFDGQAKMQLILGPGHGRPK